MTYLQQQQRQSAIQEQIPEVNSEIELLQQETVIFTTADAADAGEHEAGHHHCDDQPDPPHWSALSDPEDTGNQ